MGRFTSLLAQYNLSYTVGEVAFKPVLPINTRKFADLVEEIVAKGLRVYIHPDCDPDGYFSALCMKKMFDYVGYKNYVVGRNHVRSHSIRESFMANVLNEKFDVIILVDSSTNNMSLIQYVLDRGAKIVIIDHHDTKYRFEDYPKDAIVINPRIDALYKRINYDQLSCGAICSMICDYILRSKFKRTSMTIELYIYGFITLYSDICDLSNPYNISYIKRFHNLSVVPADIVNMFWDEYSNFDRSFVSYKLIPRINALARTERFDLLHEIFFELEDISRTGLLAEIERIYSETKVLVKELKAACQIEQYANFAIAKLPVSDRIVGNFTGLIANDIATELNVCTMCIYKSAQGKFNGSVRDPFSRNMLNVFQTLCTAEGHPPAFGIEIPEESLPSMVNILNNLDSLFEERKQDVILVSWDNLSVSEILNEIPLMVEYGCLGGQGLPKALAVLSTDSSFDFEVRPKFIRIRKGPLKFTCFNLQVVPGDTLLISPTSDGPSYSLLINNIMYGKIQ